MLVQTVDLRRRAVRFASPADTGGTSSSVDIFVSVQSSLWSHVVYHVSCRLQFNIIWRHRSTPAGSSGRTWSTGTSAPINHASVPVQSVRQVLWVASGRHSINGSSLSLSVKEIDPIRHRLGALLSPMSYDAVSWWWGIPGVCRDRRGLQSPVCCCCRKRKTVFIWNTSLSDLKRKTPLFSYHTTRPIGSSAGATWTDANNACCKCANCQLKNK